MVFNYQCCFFGTPVFELRGTGAAFYNFACPGPVPARGICVPGSDCFVTQVVNVVASMSKSRKCAVSCCVGQTTMAEGFKSSQRLGNLQHGECGFPESQRGEPAPLLISTEPVLISHFARGIPFAVPLSRSLGRFSQHASTWLHGCLATWAPGYPGTWVLVCWLKRLRLRDSGAAKGDASCKMGN